MYTNEISTLTGTKLNEGDV